MGCDMVVALAPTTVDGRTLFGHNCNRPGGDILSLVQSPTRTFEPGQMVETNASALPQVRKTHAVLGATIDGLWGYFHGVNGPDLVRLGLERAGSARQAADVLTDLIARHHPGTPAASAESESALSPALLIADPTEAFVLVTCGAHWALQQISSLRALSDVCHLHQDWSRLSPGLGAFAIARGWWPEDGSKLDFEATLCLPGPNTARALRRYGRATLLLEQQRGHHKPGSLRRILCDHFDGCPDEVDPCGLRLPAPSLCCHGAQRGQPGTAGSLLVQLAGSPTGQPLAWYAFGTPCTSVYLPLFFEGELPLACSTSVGGRPGLCQVLTRLQASAHGDRLAWVQLRQAMAGLQDRIDQETKEFLEEAVVLRQRGADAELRSLTTSLMQHQAEQVEDLCGNLDETAPSEEEMAAFGF
jgi:secernin